ncbi:MAG TPA: zinc ribbon domain-containing protein [Ktedonobacteraceae bacterium]|nr:zinc ribbon domain-containing protein [Ktedonobacteraceae bacterium]
MDIRYYNAQGIDIEHLASNLERMFANDGYQTQHFGTSDHMTMQMRKGSDVAAVFGMRSALTIVMQRSPEGLQVMIGQQRWVEKAAVGAVGFFFPLLWPLVITAGAGVFMQANLVNRVVNELDALVHQQIPNAQRGSASTFIPSFPNFIFRQAPTVYAPAPLICSNCQAANEPGDKFCMQCGSPLTPKVEEKAHCANCGAEMKAGAAFCTKCGTATAA